MSPLPSVPFVEIYVPNANTEEEFLLLAVQAAVRKYRETHYKPVVLLQTTSADGCTLPQSVR
jgi:hypothetical protein